MSTQKVIETTIAMMQATIESEARERADGAHCAAATGSVSLVPELRNGMKFEHRGRRFEITQICGETVYLKMPGCEWDASAPRAGVEAAIAGQPPNPAD